jgi:hypothetical protein
VTKFARNRIDNKDGMNKCKNITRMLFYIDVIDIGNIHFYYKNTNYHRLLAASAENNLKNTCLFFFGNY